MIIELPNGSERTKVLLKNVLYALRMAFTLISVSCMDKAGMTILVNGGMCKIITPPPESKVIARIPLSQGLYRISGLTLPESLNACAANPISISDLHRRMGHISHGAARHAVTSGLVTGVNLDFKSVPSFCETCIKARIPRLPFPKESNTHAKVYGERAWSDVWGPAPVESIGHKTYMLTFTDEASRESVLYFIPKKSDVFANYKNYEAWVKKHRNKEGIKNFRSDRAGDYLSNEFKNHLKVQGTHHELTVHDSPPQNGMAEVTNRVIVTLGRSLMIGAGLPRFLWTEAFHHASWIKFHSPHAALPGTTPYEVVHKQKPNLGHLHEFGTTVYVKDLSAGKLDVQAKVGKFVGYDDESKGYRVYRPEKRSVTIEREVRFNPDEVLIPDDRLGNEGEWPNYNDNGVPNPTIPAPIAQPLVAQPPPANIEPEHIAPRPPEQPVEVIPQPRLPNNLDPPEPNTGRGFRTRPNPGHYARLNQGNAAESASFAELIDDVDHNPLFCAMATYPEDDDDENFALATAPGDEPSWQDAIRGPDREKWLAARDVEVNMLDSLNTFDVVPKPPGVNIVPTHYVCKKKRDAQGDIDKFKVRFVAGGHMQIYGVDYQETFAPVTKIASHRINLAYAAQHGWATHQLDIKSAYLNAHLKETIYIRLPPGYLKDGQDGKVGKLNKGLYGLKQAGRAWYLELRGVMVDKLGFKVCDADHGVFIKHDAKNNQHIIVAVATDDMDIIANMDEAARHFKHDISQHFGITDLGETHYLLGFEIKRDKTARTVSINQGTYIDTIAARFNLTSAKPIYTPLDPGTVLSKDQCPKTPREFDRMRDIPYRPALGAAWYAATVSRPDISFVLSTLSQFAENPGEVHWRALQCVIVYLKTTRNLWLIMGGDPKGADAFTDSDWASQAHRHSISGYLFRVGSGTVTWSSKKQSIIALSSTEAEYIAQTSAAKEALWLRSYWKEITDTKSLAPTKLHSNNQGAIALAKSAAYHSRTKHIDIRYHFIRDTIERQVVSLTYCPTEDMVADILTKAVPRQQFEKLRNLMGVRAA